MKSLTTSFRRLAVFGVALTISTLSVAEPIETAAFRSPQGYTIVPPAEMHQVEVSEPGMDVEFDEDADDGMQFTVTVAPTDPGVSLEQGLRATRAKLEEGLEAEHYKVLEQGAMTLDGSKALTLTASLAMKDGDNPKAPDKPYRILTLITYHGENSYVFNDVGSELRFMGTLDSIKKSLASLRWTK